MTLRAGESRCEKCLHQFPGEGVADHEATETDQVQIVVLDTLVRRKVFVNQAGPDPGHFVCADRSPDTASADSNAAFHRPGGNRAGQRHDEIRIVIVLFRAAVAKVNHFMTGFAQLPSQIFFQFVTAVIGGDTDAFRCYWQDWIASNVHRYFQVEFTSPDGDTTARQGKPEWSW